MSDIKISIIMPVYNVEDYISRCIESVLSQTLSEFEFLIVDDGSKDRSGAICDEFAARDSRIKVIHKENGGAPSARNTAIEIAKGRYMYFMDADDWAEENMLQSLYDMAEKNSAQLVVSGFYIDTYYQGDKFVSEQKKVDDRVYTNAQDFRENAYKYFDRNLLYTPWNKLFLSEYLMEHKLRFPHTFWDDFPFNISVLKQVERVVVTSQCFYHFIRARADSETASYRADMYKKREEEHGWLLDLYDEWGIHDEASREMLSRRYIERVVGCFANLTSSKCKLTHKEKMVQIKEILDNPRVDEALKYAKPRSGYMKLMLVPIRMKSKRLVWLESSVITAVMEKNTKLFAELKAGR